MRPTTRAAPALPDCDPAPTRKANTSTTHARTPGAADANPRATPRASGNATERPRKRLRHDEGAGTTHTVTASPAAHTLPVTPPTLPGGDPTGATTSRRDVPRAAPASSKKSDTSVRAACLAVRTMRRKGPE